MSKNGKKLALLIAEMGIGVEEALTLFNKGRAEPLAKSHWHAFNAEPTSSAWKPCPDSVAIRMETLHRDWLKEKSVPIGISVQSLKP